MNSALRFGFGNALNAMNAAFVFEFTVNALADDRKHYFLNAAQFGKVGIYFLGFPTIFFGVL